MSKGRKYYFLEGIMQAHHILRRIAFADRWKRACWDFKHVEPNSDLLPQIRCGCFGIPRSQQGEGQE